MRSPFQNSKCAAPGARSIKLFCFFFTFSKEGLRVGRPILLGLVVRFFSPNTDVMTKEAYLYGLGLVLCTSAITMTIIPFQFLRQNIGMKARAAVTALLYKKVRGK